MSESFDARRNVLLLTATITPPKGAPQLARTDPEVRRRDYETALASYLPMAGGVVDQIVFAENSNSDLSSLRALAERAGRADRVEFIVFDGLDHPSGYGRGYGEFKLVDYVMSHSRVIDAHRESAAVWKVTGRYLVRNLERIIRRAPSNFDLYCNCRNRPRRWADMFLMAWSPRGHRSVIRDCYQELNEEGARASAEVRFRELVDAAPVPLRVTRRFTVTPLVEGVRGLDNQSYSRGKSQLKYFARSAVLFVAPWLWI